MWKTKTLKKVITLMWGHDDGDDIYIEHPLTEVSPELYHFLTRRFGIPRGVIKDTVFMYWESEAC